MPRNSSTWLDVVSPDVIDVVARPLVRLRPVGEALEELVGLLRYQLETGVVLLLVLLVGLQRTARGVDVRPTLKYKGAFLNGSQISRLRRSYITVELCRRRRCSSD